MVSGRAGQDHVVSAHRYGPTTGGEGFARQTTDSPQFGRLGEGTAGGAASRRQQRAQGLWRCVTDTVVMITARATSVTRGALRALKAMHGGWERGNRAPGDDGADDLD